MNDTSKILSRLLTLVTTESTPEAFAQQLAQLFADATRSRLAVLRVREGETLVTKATVGFEGQAVAASSVDLSDAFSGLQPLHASATLLTSVGASPLGWTRAMRVLVAVPLRLGENLMGAVYVDGADLLPEHEPALELLASHAAAAVMKRHTRTLLEQGLRARDDLLAVVAHDLRNPLNVVTVSAQNLLRRLTEPAALRAVERIVRGAQRADRLIRDLLDVNAIENGRFSVERRAIDTTDVVLSALDSQHGPAADASVVLDSDLSPDLAQVNADEERLLEVLENLISNAVKFTDPGGLVSVGACMAGDHVQFTVKDAGPGVLPEHLPHLFDRFWQARRHDRRGTGLGLTICKAIVEAHGGRIWAESVPGEGTTMSFTIPAGAPAVATPDLDTVSNILLVDDRHENLLALKAILQQPSYRILTASSGEEALRLSLREHFDVALIDVAMPGMDGIEVAGHLKALERCRDVPILFVTAFGHEPEEIRRAYAAGGADYLVKPLDADIVRKKVAVFTGLRRRRSAAGSTTETKP